MAVSVVVGEPLSSLLSAKIQRNNRLQAASLTGRWARGLEIDPAYVDVALERWIAMTGERPILEATGETFEQRQAALTPEYNREDTVDAA